MICKTLFTLDKLSLMIKYPEYKTLNSLIYKNIKGVYLKSIYEADSKYEFQHAIYYKDIEIGILKSGFELNKIINHLYFYNFVFYSHANLLKVFINDLDKLNLPVEVSRFEIACDFNSKTQLNRFKKSINKNKLRLKRGYEVGKYETIYRDDKKVNGDSTLYFKESKKHTQKPYLRLENKTVELINSKKKYITDYHFNNGLDTSKPIYRFELVIPQMKCLDVGINTFYKSRDSDKMVSKATIDKYKKIVAKKEFESKDKSKLLFDDGYYKLKDIIYEYTELVNVKSRYDIDITKLIDQAYLKIIFNTFSNSIILDSKSHFLKSIYTNIKLKIKKENMKSKTKKAPKFIESKEFEAVKYISSELGIDYVNARDLLISIIHKYANAGKVRDDLFDLV